MAATCPNKNHPDWKDLVNKYGESLAFYAYDANGEDIPSFERGTQLIKEFLKQDKKALNQIEKQQNNPYGQFKLLNRDGSRKIYADTQENWNKVRERVIEINKAQGDYKASMMKVENPEGRGNKPYLSIGLELRQKSDYKSMPSTSKVQTESKFEGLIEEKKYELKVNEKLIAKFKEIIKKETDPIKKAKGLTKLSQLNTEREKIKQSIEEIKKMSALGDVERFAEEHMKELERIFNQKDSKGKLMVSMSDLARARKMIQLWMKAGDFSQDDHLFFDRDELESATGPLKEIFTKFIGWRTQAELYNNMLQKTEESILDSRIHHTFGKNFAIDFSKAVKDVNAASQLMLDISEMDNVILQSMATWLKEANFAANREAREIFETVDHLIKKANIKDFELFQQKFSKTDQRRTGNLVHRFSQEFFTKKRDINAKRNSMLDHNNPTKYDNAFEANANYFSDLKKIEQVVDVRKLFPDAKHYIKNEWNQSPDEFTTKDRDEHIKKLKELLGDEGFTEYYLEAEKQLERYKIDYEVRKSITEAEHPDDTVGAARELAYWEYSNSPYWYAHFHENGYSSYEGIVSNPHSWYTITIANNKESYDEQFKQIEGDEHLLNLYNYFINTIKETKDYLPDSEVDFMRVNTIPFIRKEIVDNFSEGGMVNGLAAIWDKMKEATRVNDLEAEESSAITGEKEKNFNLNFIVNSEQKIREYVNIKKVDYKTSSGEEPTKEMIAEWRKEAMDQLAQEKSFDLGKVLKAWSMMALAYKHKAAIEDQMRIGQNIINRTKSATENSIGETIIKQGGLTNTKKMLDTFMDHYWGYAMNIPEGKTKKKVYTSDEKERKATLERVFNQNEKAFADGKIKEAEYIRNKEMLEQEINSLGGVLTMSKLGDSLIKWVQLKGIGWNIFSGFNNVAFGFLANIIESADGRVYTQQEYLKAFWLTKASIGKNFTFNMYNNPDAQKIRSLMDYYDVLKELRHEINNSSNSTYMKNVKKLGFAAPFQIISRGEYVNQAPVMIAIMMHTKVQTKDGKEISLWDAYDKDGKIKEGIDVSEEVINKTKIRVDKQIKLNHGNYDSLDSPLTIKRNFLGRAVSQFRLWAFEGYATRMEKEFYDYQFELTRKGRYRSYAAYYKSEGAVNGTLKLMVELARKLAFQRTKFDEIGGEGFTEVDAANMRKNAQEIVVLMCIAAIGMMLTAFKDDDKEKRKMLAMNFWINSMSRLNTDLLFYTSPIQFEQLQRNTLPIFSVVVDTAKWFDAVSKYMQGDDIYPTGYLAHQSRLLRQTNALLPLTNQIVRLKNTMSMVY